MARDEALLEELIADAEAHPVVRVYRWDRPSVSIGRLQERAAVETHYPHLTAVRRPTGGLAVVHGDDVTISVVVRDSHLPVTEGRGVLSSYRQIVGPVVEAFRRIGVPAVLGGTARSSARTDAVDCFALAARCDIVSLDGRKLAGCAQRRKQGVVLQQMSIPCPNIGDVAVFIETFKDCFSRELRVSLWLPVDTLSPV